MLFAELLICANVCSIHHTFVSHVYKLWSMMFKDMMSNVYNIHCNVCKQQCPNLPRYWKTWHVVSHATLNSCGQLEFLHLLFMALSIFFFPCLHIPPTLNVIMYDPYLLLHQQ